MSDKEDDAEEVEKTEESEPARAPRFFSAGSTSASRESWSSSRMLDHESRNRRTSTWQCSDKARGETSTAKIGCIYWKISREREREREILWTLTEREKESRERDEERFILRIYWIFRYTRKSEFHSDGSSDRKHNYDEALELADFFQIWRIYSLTYLFAYVDYWKRNYTLYIKISLYQFSIAINNIFCLKSFIFTRIYNL